MASGVGYRHGPVGEVYVFPLGSATNPSAQFGDDNARGGYNDGLYGTSAPAIGIALNGTSYFLLSATAHAIVNSVRDADTIRLNSRNFTQATGSSIGLQSKPSQTVTSTGDVIGAEFSPRASDAGAGAIIAVRADPVVKDATAARTVSAVRGVEVNIDMPNAGSAVTVTNDVSALRVFPDFGSGHTFSGIRSIILAAAPNTSNFDAFLHAETGNATWISITGASASIPANTGFVLIRHGTTYYRLPVYANS